MYSILCIILQRYEEAEKSYVKAVQLDSTYKDAEEELFKMRSEQLEVGEWGGTHTHAHASTHTHTYTHMHIYTSYTSHTHTLITQHTQQQGLISREAPVLSSPLTMNRTNKQVIAGLFPYCCRIWGFLQASVRLLSGNTKQCKLQWMLFLLEMVSNLILDRVC